jgi:hypothetical protein
MSSQQNLVVHFFFPLHSALDLPISALGSFSLQIGAVEQVRRARHLPESARARALSGRCLSLARSKSSKKWRQERRLYAFLSSPLLSSPFLSYYPFAISALTCSATAAAVTATANATAIATCCGLAGSC